MMSVVFANAISISDWIMDGDALELCEKEAKDSENEELKTETEKDEILTKNFVHNYGFLLPKFLHNMKEIDLHSIQCREILTPPPDFS